MNYIPCFQYILWFAFLSTTNYNDVRNQKKEGVKIMNELGEYLKKLRKEKGLSIRKASEGIGISHTYLDSLEKGYDPRTKKERIPTPEVLGKISQFYDIPFFKLMDLSNQIKGEPIVFSQGNLDFFEKILDDEDEISILKIMIDVMNGKSFVLGADKKLSHWQSLHVVSLMNKIAELIYERKTRIESSDIQSLDECLEKILKEGE